jgi:hypothetical protein
MNKFTQHVPSFVDISERFESEFNNTEELLEFNYVQAWSNLSHFHQFSISDNKLMAEFKDGTEWWVIGYIKNPKDIQLPEWVYKEN